MIIQATINDLAVLLPIIVKLWGRTEENYFEEYQNLLTQSNSAIFLFIEAGNAYGFAQCQLRQDYVEGTNSSPVGYLEGIYVEDTHRRQGIAGELLSACQKWAKHQDCTEFASDCELDNYLSYHFHLHYGFIEVNRIICFKKELVK